MAGGTTFHFVTDGIHAALDARRPPPSGRDVRLGGGAATIRQYLRAGLIDEMHFAIAPVLLGSGEHLFAGLDLPELGYRCAEHVATARRTSCYIADGTAVSFEPIDINCGFASADIVARPLCSWYVLIIQPHPRFPLGVFFHACRFFSFRF